MFQGTADVREWVISVSHSVVSNSLQPHGLYSPWNSPGQNTGVGSLSLLQGIFPTQGVKPRSPAMQVDSLPAEPQGKPQNELLIESILSTFWRKLYRICIISSFNVSRHSPVPQFNTYLKFSLGAGF